MIEAFRAPSDPSAIEQGRDHVNGLVEFSRKCARRAFGSAEARPVESVGIVGAGRMGAAIAAVCIDHGLRVVVTDVSADALACLPGHVAAALAEGPAGQSATGAAKRRGVLEPAADLEAVARCDLVIETIIEQLQAKHALLRDLEPKLDPATVLASNTSTIALRRLGAPLLGPERFCGIHFLRPVPKRPIVEIVRAQRSSSSAVATAIAFAERIGKIPVVVNDAPGFVVNRLLLPYAGEAMGLLLEGASIEAIERAAADFGMAMGPLALLDEVGLDTALTCGVVFASAYPGTIPSAPLLVAMVKAKLLGRKTGRGFFVYDHASAGAPTKPNPALQEFIARWAEMSHSHTGESIAARLFLPMLLEATRILDEGIVPDPRLVDLAAVLGLGFPASRGGLLYWADQLGAGRVVEMLSSLEPLGKRARPTPLLEAMAKTGARFYREEA